MEICGGVVEQFNMSHLSRSQPSHLCYGFTVTNEKSICPVDSDVVLGQRSLASCSCFSVMSFNVQFTGEVGFGEGRLSLVFSCVLCFSYLKLYNHFLGHERLTNSSDEQLNHYTLHSYTHNIKGDLLCSLATQ